MQYETTWGDSARCEARRVVDLVGRGMETIESARRLIDVSEEQERFLRKVLRPDRVMRAIRFRRQVLAEFNQLMAAGTQ